MSSAPQSPSVWAPKGPNRTVVRSRMRMPASGPVASVIANPTDGRFDLSDRQAHEAAEVRPADHRNAMTAEVSMPQRTSLDKKPALSGKSGLRGGGATWLD